MSRVRTGPALIGANLPLSLLTSLLLSQIPGLLGCHPRVELPTYPSNIELPSAEVVQQELEAQRARALTTLTATFTLVSEANGKKDRIHGALAVASRPESRFRLELFSPIGTPAMYAVARPDQASLFLPYSGKLLLTSPDPVGLLQRVTGGGMTFDGLMQTLLGAPPPCELTLPLAYEASEGWIVASCQGGTALLLEPADLRVRGVRLQETSEEGGQTFLLRLDAPFEVPGATAAPSAPAAGEVSRASQKPLRLPGELVLETGGDEAGLRMHWTLDHDGVTANPSLEESLFVLELPSDAQVGSLEAWLLQQSVGRR